MSESVGEMARGAGVVFIGTILGQGLGLFGELVIANSLSPEWYGDLSLAYTVVLLASTVVLFGLHNGVTRMMTTVEGRAEERLVFYHGHLLILCLGVVAAFCLTLGREYVADLMDEPALSGLLMLFLPLLVINPVRYVSYGALRAENRAAAAVAAKDISGRTLPLLFLCGAVYLSHETVGAVAYWLGFPLVMLAVSVYFLRDRYRYREIVEQVPDERTVKRLWSFSWPLAFSAFVFIFLSYLDILMIGYFLDSEFVGYYRSIQPLREATMFALSAFSFIYMPMATEYFENGNFVDLGRLYTASTKWVMMGTFPIVLVLGLFADDVVRATIGSPYLPAAPVLTILVFGLFFRAVVGLNGSTIKAIDETRIELVSAAIGLGANFLLNVALIPGYGIRGAAIATVAGYVVYNTAEVVAIYRVTGIHPFSVNNTKPLVPPLLAGLGIAHVLASSRVGLLGLAAIGILLGVVQLLSPFLTGSITQEDTYLLKAVEEAVGVQLPWSG